MVRTLHSYLGQKIFRKGHSMNVSMLFRSATAALLFAGTLAMPTSAATLLGDFITASYLFPNADSVFTDTAFVSPSPTFTVVAGPEATGTVDFSSQTFDFEASSFTLTLLNDVFFTPADFNGWQFVNNSKAFDAITSVTGIDPTRVTTSDNTLRINWQNIAFRANDVITVDFGASVVPEPASWMLMIGGLGLAGAAMRRRRVVSIA